MKTSTSTSWIVGTAVLVVALFAGGWFLLVGPTLANASATRQQASDIRDANVTLTAKIATLKKQFAQIDTFKADLATLRTQVPATADTANLLRGLQSAAQTTGVTLISVTPGTPVASAASAPAASSELSGAGVTNAQSATGEVTTSADGSTTGASSTAAAAAAATGLVAIPLQLDVLGSYAATTAFLDQVQAKTGRLYYVTSVNVAAQKDGAASGGRPATTVGDAELQLSGYVFVLPAQATASSTGTATPTPLPAAVPGKNPLVPAAG